MNLICRFCSAPLTVSFADLGMSPISNDYVAPEHFAAMEPFYPLHAYVCGSCWLVQLIDFEKAENMFSDEYAYFSSYSQSWLAHAERYAAKMIVDEKLSEESLVIEIASNDGYLLQYFKQSGVRILGIEPTANTAQVAWEQRGVESEVAFFGRATAERLRDRGIQADVMAANNVLAHVPDINDFISGYPILLKKGGVANIEFPHLLRLIEQRQFDTIYHEHFSYLSFTVVRRMFAEHGMRVYDVEELQTHGGSLRVYIAHQDDMVRADTPAVAAMLEAERGAGLLDLETYRRFSDAVVDTKLALLEFLVAAKRKGKTVAGYGAPAKGNTLLNYCGVKSDLIAFTVDRSPHKAGKFLPGTRIPIYTPDRIDREKPDYLLILPWNLREEIMEQMAHVRDWGCAFVTPIPTVKILQ
ncbi:class I SAM-dependent methyltransferase [Sphingobium subterraneum]|uniref:2-polyprenyl-3-methyl-5-hydroxy-6-metoxy-1, 4-benzoquinol methylase n=1 Tax=Sphingobium subterraneum TaxID=627688 RepID=A0A841IYS4_9SPHN|nr:class I SAM-dependent methyltransferase [Sphingobium subterraneum]MBB6123747.1 2-polyprenyl-3-methyl-5-hydroxy-6-metoxy-1,4-benzoquinol methylase [Sphingobium subterraneum]